MTKTFRIVRRAYSQYADIETFTGTWFQADDRAMMLQRANLDGEYLVRLPDQPNWEPGGYQYGPSGMITD